jgi:hypothetical protein
MKTKKLNPKIARINNLAGLAGLAEFVEYESET